MTMMPFVPKVKNMIWSYSPEKVNTKWNIQGNEKDYYSDEIRISLINQSGKYMYVLFMTNTDMSKIVMFIAFRIENYSYACNNPKITDAVIRNSKENQRLNSPDFRIDMHRLRMDSSLVKVGALKKCRMIFYQRFLK